ncbi:MAG: glucose-6-phosphate isomerase [Verrucomicrobia bacterium GWF2_51_19]|nr:MAG: glucose-6-phosphate isomerase [Verrucomicrobia bacterium GWF2_51_19]HCJ11849.1 glucose-6-phosphate isomerase [Opitutae bacterium]
MDTWTCFKKNYLELETLPFALDLSKMDIPEAFFQKMSGAMTRAFESMEALEKGAIANPDEKRQVGHYWLRNPALAPNIDIRNCIEEMLESVLSFARKVHSGVVIGQDGPFEHLLCIGIGGSSLNPQFVSYALQGKFSPLQAHFLDNTDPDGIDRVLESLKDNLGRTLVVTISKSGSTPEPRNALMETEAFFKKHGLVFGKHAVAITSDGSQLDRYAKANHWLATFPMWEWVGGRVSGMAAVGLLPDALQGIDIEVLLEGAKKMDEVTRVADVSKNPAAQLALAWFYATDGNGSKNMVILPYKDRLLLFSRYLQQLIMESLGQEKDFSGKIVNQGISVFGNKGSTDQHSFIQQLRDGLPDFFVTFIEVLKDREGESIEVEPNVTSGDYLHGFFLGTREALYEKGRKSITLTIDTVSPLTLGMLVALFERTVGLYAYLVGINAYHQPGVEAGKKAATKALALKKTIVEHLQAQRGKSFTVDALSITLKANPENIFKTLEHLYLNHPLIEKTPGATPFDAQYQYL